MKHCNEKTKCRLCGSTDIVEVLDLGVMPLANAFLRQEDLEKEELCFPLSVNFCRQCFSAQLRHTVDGEVLFKNYHYFTSASHALAEHFYALADEIYRDYVRSPNDLVAEIGSNDGCLLSRLKGKCRILGIDPAENVTKTAKDEKVTTITDFFTTALVDKIQPKIGGARVITANNVMAHIDDLRDVFFGVKKFLTDDGRFIFEVHWVGNLLNDGGFDQIYHEHLYYHSLHSLKALIESVGMIVNDVKLIPIHGESLRVYAGKSGEVSDAVSLLLERELEMGLTDSDVYSNFSNKIEANRKDLTDLLARLKASGKKIAGYGAPAKGNTLLNYFHIGPNILNYITDTTLEKQGTYTPGTHIPVVSPEILKVDPPDYLLLLSWNYERSILEKEKELRKRGVKFIIPVPEVRVV